MAAFMGELLPQAASPQNLAVASSDGEGDKLVPMRDRDVVVRAGGMVVNGPLGRTNGHGGGEVDEVAENDGGGMSLARQRDFPAHMVGLAPADRWMGQGRNIVGQRSAPLRPIAEQVGGSIDGRNDG